MGLSAQGDVFYGFVLPAGLEEDDLTWPQECSYLSLGYTGHPNNTRYYIAIYETKQTTFHECIKLNTSLFNSDGLIYEWQKMIEKFCEANRISINVDQVGWHLSSYLEY